MNEKAPTKVDYYISFKLDQIPSVHPPVGILISCQGTKCKGF